MNSPEESIPVTYLVFDIETAVDTSLLKAVNYAETPLSESDALKRFSEDRIKATGSDFVPHTYHLPISVAVAKVAADFRLIDLVVIDESHSRPSHIARDFWRGWEGYGCPTLVTFNGRGFDLPVMELAAFRFGLNINRWLQPNAKSFEQPRNRYNVRAHIDLMEFLTNFSARGFHGGLNLAASLLGKPGKLDIHGEQVQDLYGEGRISEINDYCRCDVLDTYFVFLRSRVMVGALNIDQERELVADTKSWLIGQSDSNAGIRKYVDNWGDWENPLGHLHDTVRC